ncbi:hypothetical protein ACFXPI_12010 [Streptomyces sp. NPDC059104]|uniref:hypothetical protein n=1 Tax=Streptomyces sp. NPDC059104 TaxID=3346729 RepID=UPI0036B69FB9
MTNVVPRTTSGGGVAAECDRSSAWRHLTTGQERKKDEGPGLPPGMPSVRDKPRRLADIAHKYDRFAHAAEFDAVDEVTETDLLATLLVIRELREKLQADEADLLRVARRKRVTWARLAKALGLKSRQAAERRFLQLRSDLDGAGGKPLRQADRVTYARSLRDRPDEAARPQPPDAPGAALARRLTTLPDLEVREPAWWGELADALAALAAVETRGDGNGSPEYAAVWRSKYAQRLSELLHEARDTEKVDLSGHPGLLAEIHEFCAAAETAGPS